jgi:hypothetical protein
MSLLALPVASAIVGAFLFMVGEALIRDLALMPTALSWITFAVFAGPSLIIIVVLVRSLRRQKQEAGEAVEAGTRVLGVLVPTLVIAGLLGGGYMGHIYADGQRKSIEERTERICRETHEAAGRSTAFVAKCKGLVRECEREISAGSCLQPFRAPQQQEECERELAERVEAAGAHDTELAKAPSFGHSTFEQRALSLCLFERARGGQ